MTRTTDASGHKALLMSWQRYDWALTLITLRRSCSTDPSLKYGQDTTYDISALIGLDFNHELWDIILEQMTVEEMIYTVGKNFGAIDQFY